MRLCKFIYINNLRKLKMFLKKNINLAIVITKMTRGECFGVYIIKLRNKVKRDAKYHEKYIDSQNDNPSQCIL